MSFSLLQKVSVTINKSPVTCSLYAHTNHFKVNFYTMPTNVFKDTQINVDINLNRTTQNSNRSFLINHMKKAPLHHLRYNADLVCFYHDTMAHINLQCLLWRADFHVLVNHYLALKAMSAAVHRRSTWLTFHTMCTLQQ